MRFRITPRAGFAFLILAIISSALVAANGWLVQAKLAPLIIGIPAVIFATIQLGIELTEKRGRGESEGGLDLLDQDIPSEVVIQRTSVTFVWIYALFILAWLLGLVITVPIFVFSYLMLRAKEKWLTATLITGFVLLFELGLFQYMLNVRWFPGVFPVPQKVLLGFFGG